MEIPKQRHGGEQQTEETLHGDEELELGAGHAQPLVEERLGDGHPALHVDEDEDGEGSVDVPRGSHSTELAHHAAAKVAPSHGRNESLNKTGG